MKKLIIIIKQEEIPFSESNSIAENIFHIGELKIPFTIITPSSKELVISASLENEFHFLPQTVIGPKVDAPQQAIEGFYTKWENKGGRITKNEKNYIFEKEEFTKTAEELAPEIVEQILLSVSKSWKQNLDIKPLAWTRPIHSISAFLNENKVNHKFEWNHNDSDLMAYEDINLVDSCKQIENKISEIERKYQITCTTKQSVKELAWLYENPQFEVAEIPNEYLHLPKEVLVLTISKNQRYILFEKNGKIVPEFLIVGRKHNKTITQGHLRTLKARLEDAKYYIEKDIKEFCIEKISPSLEKIAFHQKYGSVTKRVQEMQSIANNFFPNEKNLQMAIMLCKNDLTSNTVQSFTELQGYCGGYFCHKLGIEQEICDAISQHYKPLNPNDDLPNSSLAKKLSFIDKLQKINALANIGEIPTSSRDPFAIRRDILSIIRICDLEKWHFVKNIEDCKNFIHKELENFVTERINLFNSSK